MPNAEPVRPARDEPGADLLGLLADALLGRVEELISERLDGPAGSATREPDGRWLRVSEVAERVGACERTVYRALHSGALVGERLGAHWRIRPAAVDAWLAASRDPAAAKRPSGARVPPPAPAHPHGTTFTTRARARRSPPSAEGQPTTDRRPGARREEPS